MIRLDSLFTSSHDYLGNSESKIVGSRLHTFFLALEAAALVTVVEPDVAPELLETWSAGRDSGTGCRVGVRIVEADDDVKTEVGPEDMSSQVNTVVEELRNLHIYSIWNGGYCFLRLRLLQLLLLLMMMAAAQFHN